MRALSSRKASLSIAALAALIVLFPSCGERRERVLGTLDPPEAKKAAAQAPASYDPFKRKDGKRFRIAVVQSGEYKDYYIYLQSLFDGFAALDWMDKADTLGWESLDMRGRLARLAETQPSSYVEFPPDAQINLDWEDKNLEGKAFKALLARTDIDAYYALGTFAAKALADQPNFKKPVIGESISNPVEAGVVASVSDSGKDFLSVRCDPEQFSNQVRMFWDVVQFKTLGVLYNDSEDGRLEGALGDVRKLAAEKGFKVEAYTKGIQRLGEIPDKELPAARRAYLAGIEELAPKVDAFYFGLAEGLDDANLPKVLAALEKWKKPSFSMEGEYHVRKGVLLGTSEGDLVAAGLFNARKFVDVFRGAKPRSLPQLYKVSPNIVVNLKEAELIGFDVPVDIIASADKIYYEVMKGAVPRKTP